MMSKFLFVLMLLVNTAQAESLDYTKLQMRDLDQMRELIAPTLKAANSKMQDDDASGATEAFRDVMKMILSRPNNDNMVAQLMPEIRPRMKDLGAYEDTVSSLASEAVFALTKSKEDARRKATNVFLLQNIISEFKPEVKSNPTLRKTFELIRDEKIIIPKDVKKELLLRGMVKDPISPSELAERVIGKKP